MNFKLKDRVKYYFPNPNRNDKEYIVGEISFIGETQVEIQCIDNSKLKISLKNFNRITPLVEQEVY